MTSDNDRCMEILYMHNIISIMCSAFNITRSPTETSQITDRWPHLFPHFRYS